MPVHPFHRGWKRGPTGGTLPPLSHFVLGPHMRSHARRMQTKMGGEGEGSVAKKEQARIAHISTIKNGGVCFYLGDSVFFWFLFFG